jgi:nucleoside-diphosphate-sugar epimerase
MESILITGALGHIGSYLLDEYLCDGIIAAVDNFATQRYCSLFDRGPQPIQFIERDYEFLPDSLLKKQDCVIHLAGLTDAAGSMNKKRENEEENCTKAVRFIRRCLDAGCKVIFPSTTSVYGHSTKWMYEDSELNPQSPYALSKAHAEQDLLELGGEVYILRLGTIVGFSKGMRFHTAVNRFCLQASLGQPLGVWKQNYEFHRPYLSLADASEAIFLITNTDKVAPDVYNVVSRNYTTKEIIECIKEASDEEVVVSFVDTPLVNQFNYKVSTEKFESCGFAPNPDISEHISDTIRLLSNLNG